MYIAYKTAETLPDQAKGNFNQYGRAKVFITTAIGLNIVELVLIINSLFFQVSISLTTILYFASIFFLIGIYLGVNRIFNKAVLAKAIKAYKNTNFSEYGKGIGLIYILFNLVIAVILVFKMGKLNE